MAKEEDFPSLLSPLNDRVFPPTNAIEDACVTIKRTNLGAPMVVTFGSHGDGCSCINICINSNVQVVNNSTLIDSEVTTRDPGVHLSLSLPCCSRKLSRQSKRKKRRVRHEFEPGSRGCTIVNLCILSILFLVLFFII